MVKYVKEADTKHLAPPNWTRCGSHPALNNTHKPFLSGLLHFRNKNRCMIAENWNILTIMRAPTHSNTQRLLSMRRILSMAFSFPSDSSTSFTSAQTAIWGGGNREMKTKELKHNKTQNKTPSLYIQIHTPWNSKIPPRCTDYTLSVSLPPPVLSPSIFAHPSSSVSWPVFSFYVCIILIIQSNQSILLSFPVAGSPLSCYHSVG